MSTTHSSFDQYCISHKTISHRTAAAPGPKVHRECPMTQFKSLPLLAINPGDATGRLDSLPDNEQATDYRVHILSVDCK